MASEDEYNNTNSSAGFSIPIFFEESDETDKTLCAQNGDSGRARGRSRGRAGKRGRGRGRGKDHSSIKHSANMQNLTYENDLGQANYKNSQYNAEEHQSTGSRSRGNCRAKVRDCGPELRSRDNSEQVNYKDNRDTADEHQSAGSRSRGKGRTKVRNYGPELRSRDNSEQVNYKDNRDTADEHQLTGSRSRGKGRAKVRNSGPELRSRDSFEQMNYKDNRDTAEERQSAGSRSRGTGGVKVRNCGPELRSRDSFEQVNYKGNQGTAEQHQSAGSRTRGTGAVKVKNCGTELRSRDTGNARSETLIKRYSNTNDLLSLDQDQKGEKTSEKAIKHRAFTEKDLVILSKKDNPDEVLLDIGNSRSGFTEFLRKKVDPDLVYYVVRMLCNVSDSKMITLRREILHEVEQNFLNNLIELLNLVSLKDPKTFKVWNSPGNLSKLLRYIVRMLSVIITTLPSCLGKCKAVITAVKEVVEEHDLEGTEEVINDVEEVLKREHEVKTKSREEELWRSGRRPTNVKVPTEPGKPPDDFRHISVFPTQEDLKEDVRPFLRANQDEGRYEDLDTYLDIQFRLLREDYIQPLRNGIANYRRCIRDNISVKRLRDIRLYQSVQVLFPVCSENGINHVLQFDFTYLMNVNWVTSRRLLYGSLVCLSKDNFETTFYATITERKPEKLFQGIIQVRFEKNSDLRNIQSRDVFIMAETTAYFEAYRYVLDGIKEMNESMPLQRYIVGCEEMIQSPAYLLDKEETNYNFSCLLSRHSLAQNIPVLQLDKWPSAEELQLDSSQYAALQQAVTKELAVIQGPPGTGKTFVGLKIVGLLLKNIDVWSDEKRRHPILVVCYTNHALDQFLEGVLRYCEGKIIRIGGRCKSEIVQQFSLRTAKAKRREEKKRSFGSTQSEKDYQAELNQNKQDIDNCCTRLTNIFSNIVQYNELRLFMNEGQRQAFEFNRSYASMRTCISDWIGLPEKVDVLSNTLTLANKFQKVWETTILFTDIKMQDDVRQLLTNPWELDTGQRAELYKVWLEEWTNNVQIQINRGRNRKWGKFSALESLLLRSQKSILDFGTLSEHVKSPRSKSELRSLLAISRMSKKVVIAHWLNLLGTRESIPLIWKAIDSFRKFSGAEISEDDDDWEEERQLDDKEEEHYPKTYEKQTEMESPAKWLEKVNNTQMSYRVKALLSVAHCIKDEEADRLFDVWNLAIDKRRALYANWIARFQQVLTEKIKEKEEIYRNAAEKLQEVRDHETVEIMRAADVIGMTTTGAAKYRTLLKQVGPKIIVVEEAAEVLESHIVTTLNENCQQLILIGDHKQLRPSTTVYELSKKYKMDVSLFERMVRNGVPCVTLEEQHRMRPEISCLLKHELLYPKLRDHRSVKDYIPVKGVDANLQFIDHEEPEDTLEDSTSHRNQHEAFYIAELCQYFLNQGYDSSQITVLSPYMAQVLLLKQIMPEKRFGGVKITAVDNFQGEENDIILLSLVRSNTQKAPGRNTIGFVGIENRICVSLSRAKKGLFVLGNFGLLEEKSLLWHDIIGYMRRQDAVKPGLILRCSNHPEIFVLAATCKDFEKCPDGGCGASCGAELPCGHVCPKSCHPVDRYHERATCVRPCERIVCEQGHKCTKSCWEYCGDCLTLVEKEIPVCGHTGWMKCSKEPTKYKCREICTYVLSCGHRCNRKCFECTVQGGHREECMEEVEKYLPCEHISVVKCSDAPEKVLCMQPCTTILECGHKCSGYCGLCFSGKIHAQCSGICKKVLPCGHICSFPCSEICPPCTRPCAWKCSHGYTCGKQCWEECARCSQPCKFYCCQNRHRKCKRACFEICKIVCAKPCRRRLECGHNCIGSCGESCLCKECDLHYIPDSFWQHYDNKAIFIQLPDCGCVLELRRFDEFMNLPIPPNSQEQWKRCARCSRPIKSHLRRYTNILKQAKMKIDSKYKSLIGSVNRQQAVSKIKADLKKLNEHFLSESEVGKVERLFEDCVKVGAVSTVEQVVKNLTNLSEVEQNIADKTLALKKLIKPDYIKNLLVYCRRFPTQQFWKEVEREIEQLPRRKTTSALKDRLEAFKMKSPESTLGHSGINSHEDITSQYTSPEADLQEAKEKALADMIASQSKRKQKKLSTGDINNKAVPQANVHSFMRLNDHFSAKEKQTSDLELALGSDSVDAFEPTRTNPSFQPSTSISDLLGSDSVESLTEPWVEEEAKTVTETVSETEEYLNFENEL